MLGFTWMMFFMPAFSYQTNAQSNMSYDSSWNSLIHYQAPAWYEDAKLGFWVHWGIYSVPAFSGDHAAEWYGRWMYSQHGQSENNRGLAIHNHHLETYGDPEKYGYKDFIPQFNASKFNANQWADMVVNGGAKFFTMMGVHHDNFPLWNSKLTKWDAMDMAPHRDLLGEIEKAVRARGLKFGVSNHSGWNYEFFKFNHINHYDAIDTAFQDLYGNPIITDTEANPSNRDLNRWLARTIELCDQYRPDLYYFDWDINSSFFETRRKEFGAHYYNQGITWGNGIYGSPGVVLNYKDKAFKAGSAVVDQEREVKKTIPAMVWQTDDCVYAGDNWGYVPNVPIKSANAIIDELIDIVSKRGVLMLSFAPKPDGTFPDDQIQLATAMGEWLKINGESIYKTRPWEIFGDGPPKARGEMLNFTSNDVRFTTRGNSLYAFALEWPTNGKFIIRSLANTREKHNKIKDVQLIGSSEKTIWTQSKTDLTINLPSSKPGDIAYVFKITPKDKPLSPVLWIDYIKQGKKDNSLALSARDAIIVGTSLRVENSGNLGHWNNAVDYAYWNVDIKKSGRYNVQVKIASKNTDGARVAIETANGKTTFTTKNTGAWQEYELVTLDALELKKGKQIIKIAPAEGKAPHVNLLEVRLLP